MIVGIREPVTVTKDSSSRTDFLLDASGQRLYIGVLL